MSKDTDALATEPSGELVGISRISPELSRTMREYAEKEFHQDKLQLPMDYDTGALVHAGRHMPISCQVVPDLVWAEIDDPSHLERAQHDLSQACVKA